jgi:hypothetical protein
MRTSTFLGGMTLLVVCAGTAWPAGAQLVDSRVCRAKTKAMGCTLEDGVDAISAALRASVVAAEGPLPGKCQIDSPGIRPTPASTVVLGVLCDDASLGDSGDAMVAVCKAAATAARTTCKTACAKFNKIDAAGDEIPDTPCHYVVDKTVITTKGENLGVGANDMGQTGCRILCTANVVCVCDP